MSTVFKYEYLIPYAGFYPCLKTIIEHDDKKTASFALIDSGSTNETYIPYIIAKYAGLLNSESKTVTSTSASGEFEVYRIKLKALHVIRNNNNFTTFRDVMVRIPTENSRDLPFTILGRGTIFKRYDITFSEKRNKVILTHN